MNYQDHNHQLISSYYAQHREQLRAYVSVMMRGDYLVEDVIQDTFLRVLKKGQSAVIMPGTLHQLVFATARNLVVDWWRHRCHVYRHEHETLQSGEIISDTEAYYNALETKQLLEKQLTRLPEKQRQVFRMHVIEGYRLHEISDRLQLKYKTVENLSGKANKQVARLMRHAV